MRTLPKRLGLIIGRDPARSTIPLCARSIFGGPDARSNVFIFLVKGGHIAAPFQVHQKVVKILNRTDLVRIQRHKIPYYILVDHQGGITDLRERRNNLQRVLSCHLAGVWIIFKKQDGFVAFEELAFGGEYFAIESFGIKLEQFGRHKAGMANKYFAERTNRAGAGLRTQEDLGVSPLNVYRPNVISSRAEECVLQFDVKELACVFG